MQSVGAAINVAYLENLSTTTLIDSNPSTLGKAEIKSMEMLSQGLPGIGLVGVPTGLLVSGGLPCLVGKQNKAGSYVLLYLFSHMGPKVSFFE